MSPPSPSETLPSPLIRWEGVAAILGGVLWLVAYALSVPLGRENGPARADASASWLGWSYFAAFSGATLALGAGLAGLHVRRWRRRLASLPGLLLAVLAFASASANTLLLTGLLGPPRFDHARGGQGVMTICVSAALLGIATRREPLLPRGVSTALLATGVGTVVLIVASTLPLGPVPAYLVDDLPFALAGAAWIALGMAMRAKP
jgi:multisubunit Na+/H+ antiporter MnhB subunit